VHIRDSRLQRSKFTVMRDLNHSKLTLCRLQAVATACSKVNILVICSPSKANEDSQCNSDSEECSKYSQLVVYQLAVQSVQSTKVLRESIQTTEK